MKRELIIMLEELKNYQSLKKTKITQYKIIATDIVVVMVNKVAMANKVAMGNQVVVTVIVIFLLKVAKEVLKVSHAQLETVTIAQFS
jgi:hypothetical protein